MSKLASILFKLITNQYQSIIKGKTLEEAWKVLQERFQYINLISTFALYMKVPQRSY